MVRFAIKGLKDSYIAMSEEYDNDSKKIMYMLGIDDNSHSTVSWLDKD